MLPRILLLVPFALAGADQHINGARLNFATARYAEALGLAEEGLLIEPNDPTLLEIAAISSCETEAYEACLDHFQALVSVLPRAEPKLELALSRYPVLGELFAFQRAAAAGTSDAYLAFIESSDASWYLGRAEDALYEHETRAGTRAARLEYIRVHQPRNSARIDRAWDDIYSSLDTSDHDAIQAYVSEFPESTNLDRAWADQYALFREVGDERSFVEFLSLYPESPHVPDAKRAIYDMYAQPKEEDQLVTYVGRYPDHGHLETAWAAIFDRHYDGRDASRIRLFLDRYPAATNRDEVKKLYWKVYCASHHAVVNGDGCRCESGHQRTGSGEAWVCRITEQELARRERARVCRARCDESFHSCRASCSGLPGYDGRIFGNDHRGDCEADCGLAHGDCNDTCR